MTTYQQVIDYIFGLTVSGVKLELTRVEQFTTALGQPYAAFPTIHVAGTNGKGSTAAMLASVLEAAGLRVGLFTSPHLIRTNERIRINGTEIPNQVIMDHVTRWKPLINKYRITFFEVLTALAFVYFKDQRVNIAVIETGLGGRLDATNVITPLVSVITSVDLDHMNILGDTLEKIAGEKAGIIKSEVPVVLAENPAVVQQVVRNRARERKARYIYAPDECEIVSREVKFPRQTLTARMSGGDLAIDSPLLGVHQAQNIAAVLGTLTKLPFTIQPAAIQWGLSRVSWLGRMQVLQDKPPVLYDVAHNPAGVRQLLKSLKFSGFGEAVLLIGLNQRKDADGILKVSESWPGEIGLYAYQGESAVSLERLNELRKTFGHITEVFENFQSGIKWAELIRSRYDRPAICLFGSNYLAGEIFPYFNIKEADNTN